MYKSLIVAAATAFMCLHSAAAAALVWKPESSGDLVMVGVPLTAWAIAYSKDDAEGEKQLLRDVAAGTVAHAILSFGFNYTSWGERPGGGSHAFPSGHVTLVTSGAAFLQDRYGWHYGVPAYGLVGYVAYVRVHTEHHRWRDVIAGALLGTAVSKFFVTPFEATHIAPVIGPEFIGFRWERSF
jgi:membrane-associated phospholipid phosphatase